MCEPVLDGANCARLRDLLLSGNLLGHDAMASATLRRAAQLGDFALLDRASETLRLGLGSPQVARAQIPSGHTLPGRKTTLAQAPHPLRARLGRFPFEEMRDVDSGCLEGRAPTRGLGGDDSDGPP